VVERHQVLPAAGPEREALRQRGQFWTPDWVAEPMVAYVLGSSSDHLFDPAVGSGAFFHAAKRVNKAKLSFLGTETDLSALEQAKQEGLHERELSGVEIRDFVLDPPSGPFKAIVANPPYIRHHRLSPEVKDQLRLIGARLVGRPLDGRAGLHIYFLLRALELLDANGRLAFIMPADTCEGVFSDRLWAWITANYRVDGVLTFSPDASPFPGVDTNAVVFLISRRDPLSTLRWARCEVWGSRSLTPWIDSDFAHVPDDLQVWERDLQEALNSGLSRPPSEQVKGPLLGSFARTMRGVVTGANDFFFLTQEQARDIGIPDEFLLPAVGRTRDVPDPECTTATLNLLEESGRPNRLFSPDGRSLDQFPEPVRQYLLKGEELGLPHKTLISLRRPWYKMETRAVPPLLFAYLGRRNARFIRNRAGVVPLTGFLCVYPTTTDPELPEKLWEVLQDPQTIANLARVGKSYGGGAIKVEPRALERLVLPEKAAERAGLPDAEALAAVLF
jgi:adenine-specific DNA-methyltransferase